MILMNQRGRPLQRVDRAQTVVLPNDRLQRPALRAAAEPERQTDSFFLTILVENVSKGTSKTLRHVLSGTSDAAIRLDELRPLLPILGFEMRVRGSHHIFRKAGIEEKINLQREGSEAKPYQVRQVRHLILKFKLGDEDNG